MDHSNTPQSSAKPERHSYVHPIFRGFLNAIAPIDDPSLTTQVGAPSTDSRLRDAVHCATADRSGEGSSMGIEPAAAFEALAAHQGPLTPEMHHVARVVETAIDPAQAAYRALVDELAANIGDEGLYDPQQLRALSNAERAMIVLANPDVLNHATFEPDDVAAMIQGTLDPREWVLKSTDGALRKWLFEDVCAEVEKDTEIVRQDSMDPYQRRGESV